MEYTLMDFIDNVFTIDTIENNLVIGPIVLFISGIIIAYLDDGELYRDLDVDCSNAGENIEVKNSIKCLPTHVHSPIMVKRSKPIRAE